MGPRRATPQRSTGRTAAPPRPADIWGAENIALAALDVAGAAFLPALTIIEDAAWTLAQRHGWHVPEDWYFVALRACHLTHRQPGHRDQPQDLADWFDRDVAAAYWSLLFSLTSKAGRERSLLRYDTLPQAAVHALMLERRSLALNPRVGLIAGDRFADLIAERRPAIDAMFQDALDAAAHAVYEVRRLWRPRGDNPLKVANANRDLRVLTEGTRTECVAFVRALGPVDVGEDGIERVYRRRRGALLPTREHFVAAGPAGALPKCMSSFEDWWTDLDQLAMAV